MRRFCVQSEPMSNPSIALGRPSLFAVCGAGLLALAIAMGIGRFAFTPMLPLMIRAGSADVGAGGWLAAANYAGYLLGALTAARLPLTPQRIGPAVAGRDRRCRRRRWAGSIRSRPGCCCASSPASRAPGRWSAPASGACRGWRGWAGRTAPASSMPGVGVGIALAGLYCWRAGAAGVAPDRAVAAPRRCWRWSARSRWRC